MGNTCAQDCAASDYNNSTEASFDANAERYTVPQYDKVKVLSARANVSELPRLGLGTQSQESLSKRRPSASEDRQAETTKVTFGVDEHILPTADLPTQPTCPVQNFPSKESVQPTSIPDEYSKYIDDDRVASVVQETEEMDQEARTDLAGLEGEGPEEEQDKPPVIEQGVEPVVQALQQKIEPPVEAAAVEEKAPSNSLGLELVFDVKGEKKIIQLYRRPLGAEFTKRIRGFTKIDKIRPHSYASELGMEVGWAIQSIGGEDVSKKSFAEVQTTLKNGMMALPTHA